LLHHKRKPPSLNSGYQVLIPKIILGKHGGEEGMIDFMNERKLMDLVNSWDYVPSYEDKDGDWMLVGDVPWPMFVDTCKRLRLMKGSDAIGLGMYFLPMHIIFTLIKF